MLSLLSRFTLDDLIYSLKVMAHYRPLSEIATANMAEEEDVDRVVSATEIARMVGENPTAPNGEAHLSSPDAADDSLEEGGSDDENS
jgi:hypothetical protein